MTRRLIFVVVAVLVLLAVAFLMFRFLFSEPQTVSGPVGSAGSNTNPVALDADQHQVVVEHVVGTVEERAADGTWKPLKSGQDLPVDAIIRTSASSSVSLNFGGARVMVDENTQLSLPQLARAGGVRIGEGRIEANVPFDRGSFRVEVDGNDTVARSEGGEFSVLTMKGEQTTVAAKKGEVELSAKNKTVTVRAGQLSTVHADEPPSEPRSIPGSLFLKVRSPTGAVRQREYELTGLTTPGAIISVNGVWLRVDKDGQFKKLVTLEEGSNAFEVIGRDVAGRESTAKLAVTADTRPPPVNGEMTWGK